MECRIAWNAEREAVLERCLRFERYQLRPVLIPDMILTDAINGDAARRRAEVAQERQGHRRLAWEVNAYSVRFHTMTCKLQWPHHLLSARQCRLVLRAARHRSIRLVTNVHKRRDSLWRQTKRPGAPAADHWRIAQPAARRRFYLHAASLQVRRNLLRLALQVECW